MAQDWTWWAGHKTSVDDDGTYDIDNGATREAVIASALRETRPGEQFYVIHARMGDWEDGADDDDRHPFLESHSPELLTNGPVA